VNVDLFGSYQARSHESFPWQDMILGFYASALEISVYFPRITQSSHVCRRQLVLFRKVDRFVATHCESVVPGTEITCNYHKNGTVFAAAESAASLSQVESVNRADVNFSPVMSSSCHLNVKCETRAGPDHLHCI
jgi:hypothetical protein